MLQNKRGLSAIVLTVIMIGLTLVAVGIVWVVVSGLLTGQTESLKYSEKCLGLNFDVSAPVCDGATCNVTIKRSAGSGGEVINGFGVTLTDADGNSIDEVDNEGDIAVTKMVSISTRITATKANVRVYFTGEDGAKHYCNNIFSSA